MFCCEPVEVVAIAVEMGGDEGCSSKGSTRAIGDEDEGLRKEEKTLKLYSKENDVYFRSTCQ